jgi:hypothetical protein
MFTKSTLVAAVLAGASAVTAYEHPTYHGGHGRPHLCKTTSTVVVYATETATVYEGAGGEGGWTAGGSTAAGATGASPTYGGGAPAGPATVTVTATYSVDSEGNGHTWGAGYGSAPTTTASGSSTTADSGNGGGKGGFGGGYGSGSTTTASGSTTTADSGNGGGKGGNGGGYGSGSTTSTPTGSGPTGVPSALCLTNATASYLSNGYGQLLSAYTNATANSLLSADFSDTSDSINWLAGIPLGGATFGTKAAFIAGQGSQPPIGFSIQSVMFSCTQVAFRWTATVGKNKFPAKGINMFTASNLNNTEAGWQIQTMYSEFDVGAWEVDIGRTCTPQGANIAGSA